MHSFLEFVTEELAETRVLLDALEKDVNLHKTALHIAELCIQSLRNDGTIYFAGNGGSAADAQHLSAELSGRMNYDRPPLSSHALTANSSAITAIGNDYGYDQVFARQLEGCGKVGDVFIGISTSGNSKNVVNAMKVARAKGVHTVAMTGEGGGAMKEYADLCLAMPTKRTPKIQEGHIMFGHAICGIIEEALYGAEHNPKTGSNVVTAVKRANLTDVPRIKVVGE